MFVFTQRKIHMSHICPWSRIFIQADDVDHVLKTKKLFFIPCADMSRHCVLFSPCFFCFFFDVKDIFFKPACLVEFAGCMPFVLCCLFYYVVFSPRCCVSTVRTDPSEAAFMSFPLHFSPDKKTRQFLLICALI